jgi:hypothetical protein
MKRNVAIEYANSGLDIQYAMNNNAERYPDKLTRPDHILWNGIKVQTVDWWDIPHDGVFRLELLSIQGDVEQGVDIRMEEGWTELGNGERVPLLRTWKDIIHEDVIEYSYYTKIGKMSVWNVFVRRYGENMIKSVEERWTGNSGFWVERLSDFDRIYHCSHGMANSPDFDSFTFRITVTGAKTPK